MKADVPRKRRGILIPSIFTLLAVALFVTLGTWQLDRKSWKEKLIATLTQRLAAPPQALPSAKSWVNLDPSDSEFRRVAFQAEFLPSNPSMPRNEEARVYAAGSGLRDDVTGPGYFVFAPARLPDGRIVVVNRGFVPEARRLDSNTQPMARPEGPVDIIGVMRWPEVRGWFVPGYDAHNDIWYARTHLEMASQKEWDNAAPFYIEQESPIPPGGVSKPGRLKINLPNNHLQYALTWYGLAAVLTAVFTVWAWSHRREG